MSKLNAISIYLTLKYGYADILERTHSEQNISSKKNMHKVWIQYESVVGKQSLKCPFVHTSQIAL